MNRNNKRPNEKQPETLSAEELLMLQTGWMDTRILLKTMMISMRTLHRWRQNGLRHYVRGNKFYFRFHELDAWLQAGLVIKTARSRKKK